MRCMALDSLIEPGSWHSTLANQNAFKVHNHIGLDSESVTQLPNAVLATAT